MPPDLDDFSERNTTGGSSPSLPRPRATTLPLAPQQWRDYFQTKDGQRDLERYRALLSMLGSHGLPLEESFLQKGDDPIRMTAALTEMVHRGEIEYADRFEYPRTFVRRKLS